VPAKQKGFAIPITLFIFMPNMYRMNKLIALLFFWGIGISAVFSGCKRSITTNSTYSMNAKVGTSEYVNNNCMAVISDHTLVIEGLGSTSPFPTYPYIAIAIPTWFGAGGPYALDSFLGHPNLRYFSDASNYKISMYGTVTINSVSSELITGTFYCTTKDTTEITKGAFTAKVFK
jgi:hypothetical protein